MQKLFLTFSKNSVWEPMRYCTAWPERRISIRIAVGEWIAMHIKNTQVASLLIGLITGELEDNELYVDFKNFGLLHLLAISGFHFGVLAAIFDKILKLFFNIKLSHLLLILILTAYCLFLGGNPSVIRAWTVACVGLISFLVERKAEPLNSLGIALGVALLIDPWMSQQIGFVLSFAITASLLMYYAPFQAALNLLIPERTVIQLLNFRPLAKHVYLLLGFFRQAVALLLAVSVTAVPLCFYFFKSFSWMSFLFNLFFPFLISLSIFLLIFALVFSWIPLLAGFINECNTVYTKFLLSLLQTFPKQWVGEWNVKCFTQDLCLFYFFVLCIIYLNYFSKVTYNEQVSPFQKI